MLFKSNDLEMRDTKQLDFLNPSIGTAMLCPYSMPHGIAIHTSMIKIVCGNPNVVRWGDQTIAQALNLRVPI